MHTGAAKDGKMAASASTAISEGVSSRYGSESAGLDKAKL